MSKLVPGNEKMPHQVRGRVKRTSGPVQENAATCPRVYFHIERINGQLKGTESPLTFRVSKDVSLSALLAQPGDIVTIQWIPEQCRTDGAERIYIATKFHLSRKVHPLFGDDFVNPNWAS